MRCPKHRGEGDLYLALLSYRSTPLKYRFSPSMLLMARKLRTNVPITGEQLKPVVAELTVLKQLWPAPQCELKPLYPGQKFWVTDCGEGAEMVQGAGSYSYQVQLWAWNRILFIWPSIWGHMHHHFCYNIVLNKPCLSVICEGKIHKSRINKSKQD